MDALQLKKTDDCESICNINPLYLLVNHTNGYIEEENRNKYLIFNDFVDENKKVLKKKKKCADVWDRIKNKIKTLNGAKENDYGKD